MGRLLVAWLGLGALLALGLSCALAIVNPSVRGEAAASATLLMAAVYGTALTVLGVGVGAVRRSLGRPPADFAGELVAGAAAVGAALAVDLALPDLGGGLRGLVADALPLVTGLGLALALPRPRRVPRAGVAAGALALALLAEATALGAAIHESASPAAARLPEAPLRAARVLWVGIDGADWRQVRRLVAEGRLPTLAGLLERGVRAPLATFEPTWSPLIWTTQATGVRPARHGVLDFAEARLPGADCGVVRLRKEPRLLPEVLYLGGLVRGAWQADLLTQVPVTSCQRRRKAVWNILSERGRRVAVVNWFATWPAEEVDGVLISDNNPWRAAFLNAKHRDEATRVARRVTWPPHYLDRLGGLDVPDLPDDPEGLVDLPLFEEVPARTRKRLSRDRTRRLRVLRHILRSDAFAAAATARILERERPDFAAVYLSAVDNVSHRFGGLPGVVDRVWDSTDAHLARLLEAAGPDTTVLLTSDHGWSYGEPFGHDHAPDGVLLLAGPGVASPGALATPADVYDVAPTLLALFGLPPAAEMPGEPLWAALAPDLRAAVQVDGPDSYGAFVPPPPRHRSSASPLQDETLERLRELGYVE